MPKSKKKEQPLCECGLLPISPPLSTCQDCFADEAVLIDVLADILQSYGPLHVLAARPILKKALATGWRPEYLEEFQTNLYQQAQKYVQKEVIE